MTDFREEAYILEKVEITEDDIDDDSMYKEIEDNDEGINISHESDDDDLNNFE